MVELSSVEESLAVEEGDEGMAGIHWKEVLNEEHFRKRTRENFQEKRWE